MNHNMIIFLSSLILFVGCSSKPQVNLDEKPKLQVPKKTIQPIKTKKGSLYSRKGQSLFSDKKDLQVGDIIRIIIDEDQEGKQGTSNARDGNYKSNLALQGAMISPMGTNTLTKGGESRVDKFNKNFGIGINSKSESSYANDATTDSGYKLDDEITAVISIKYQNGNYFIKGSKEIMIQNQKQMLTISGVIRPYDIENDNQINSDKIANLKIIYEKTGSDADKISDKWGTKVIEAIWPF